MKLLLDTCTFLWIITDAEEIPSEVRELFIDPSNEVYLSVISAWEIALKHSLGRLPLPADPQQFVPRQRKKHRIRSLALDEESALNIARLPDIHGDPFDRMLISQALIHGLVILSPDKLIQKYPVRFVW